MCNLQDNPVDIVAGISETVNNMFLDILLLALDNIKESNLIVLSKSMDYGIRISNLEGLHFRGYNVLVPEPESEWLLPSESSVWLWNRMILPKLMSRADTVTNFDQD